MRSSGTPRLLPSGDACTPAAHSTVRAPIRSVRLASPSLTSSVTPSGSMPVTNVLVRTSTRRLSSELGDLAEQVDKDGKYGLVFDYTYDADGHPDNFYCRSDHYMYARYGIPIAFFSTGGHRDYHQVTDEVQYLDFTKYTTVTRFVADLAGRLADLDHRPVADQPKPDPKAPCKQ